MGYNCAQAIAIAAAADAADAAAAEALSAKIREMASGKTYSNPTVDKIVSENECPNQQRKRKSSVESSSQSAKRLSYSPSAPREETADEDADENDKLANNNIETPCRSTKATNTNGADEDSDVMEMFFEGTPSKPSGADSAPSSNAGSNDADKHHPPAVPNSNETRQPKLNETPFHSIRATNETTDKSPWTCRHCHHVHSFFKFRCDSCTHYNSGNAVSNNNEIENLNRRKSPRLESKAPTPKSGKEDALLSDDKSASSKVFNEQGDIVTGEINLKEQTWMCPLCTFGNNHRKKTCTMCKYNPKSKSSSKETLIEKAKQTKKKKKTRGQKASKNESKSHHHKQDVLVPSIKKSYAAEPVESDDDDVFEFPSPKSKVHKKEEPGKVPKKHSALKPVQKQPPAFSVASKKELKPLFEVGDPVYAPWWPDEERKEQPAWYLGKINDYTTSKTHGKYGPMRFYSVIFDDDNEILTDIGDEYVFSIEDYELTQHNEGRNEWIGVRNVTDDGSSDSWAKIVGWYEAEIDGETYNFSMLSEALRAYDANVIKKNGDKTNRSELNVPDEHFGVANTNNALSSSSSLQEDQSKNYSARSKLNLPDENFGVANTNHALPSSSSLQDNQPQDYSTGYAGVYLRTNQKYEAYIRTNKKHYLGRYTLAADAAMAHDKCSHQLGRTSRNFPSLAEYSSARKNESKERDVDVPRSEVVAYVNSMRCGNYAAYILHGKKRRHLGKYALAADAALACDVCLQQLGLTFTSNFANEAEYNDARSQESRERRMNVPYVDVEDHLESKVNQVVANINSQNDGEIAEEKDASPAASDINEVESLPQDEERDEEFANSQSDVDRDLVFDASPATSDMNEGASLLQEEAYPVDSEVSAANKVVASVAIDENVQMTRTRDTKKTFEVAVDHLKNDKKVTDSTCPIIPAAKTECATDSEAVQYSQQESADVKPALSAFCPNHCISNSFGMDKSKLILLTSEQCESLRFPMGVNVWWSMEMKTYAGKSIMNEGRVIAIYFDAASRDLLYEIAPKQPSATVFMAENAFAFAPSCPVLVSLDKGVSFSGSVLLCKKLDLDSKKLDPIIDRSWVYTVAIENELGMQVIDNVPSSNVTYRS